MQFNEQDAKTLLIWKVVPMMLISTCDERSSFTHASAQSRRLKAMQEQFAALQLQLQNSALDVMRMSIKAS